MSSRLLVIGVDEAGRGAWAGPLIVAAVGLTKPIDGLNDSKVLTSRRRELLQPLITKQAVFIGFGQIESTQLDEMGLSLALTKAIERAVANAPAEADIIIDGPINYLNKHKRSSALIGADGLIPAVMAASILAKVRRDKIMQAQAKHWPVYGFEKHVGYGTAAHHEALLRHGPCRIHRRSFKPIAALGAWS